MTDDRAADAGPFLGLRTCIYTVDDMSEAKRWYREVFGAEPYFDEPFYMGWNIGGYELGLTPRKEGATAEVGGVETYWGTTDVPATVARLIALGARPHSEPQDVGDGIVVATVLDPWNNIVGVIDNPHFTLP